MLMDVLHREFSREIRAEMARNRLSASALADKTHLSYSTIGRLTNAKKSPKLDELTKLAEALGVPAFELVRRAEEAASARGHNNPLDGKDVA